MKPNSNLKNVQTLLEKGMLRESLENMKEVKGFSQTTTHQLASQSTYLLSRLSTLESAKNNGIISTEKATLENNRIINSITQTLGHLKNSGTLPVEFSVEDVFDDRKTDVNIKIVNESSQEEKKPFLTRAGLAIWDRFYVLIILAIFSGLAYLLRLFGFIPQ